MIKKLVASLISAVVVIAIIVAVIVMNNPKYVFKKSLTGAIEDLGKRSELATLTQALEKGSITVEGTLGEEQLPFDGEVSFGGKFYFNAANKPADSSVYIEDLHAKVSSDGATGEIKGNAYFSTEYMYIADCNLMDGCYGLVRGDLKDEFLDSEWIDELIADHTQDAVASILDYIDKEKDMKLIEDVVAKVEEYSKTLEKLLVKYAEFEKENKNVNCGDGKTDCRVITLTVDEKAVADILNDLYDIIEKDDDLRDLVMDNAEEILDMLEGVLNEAGVEVDIKDVEDFYDDQLLDEDTWDDLVKEVEELDFEIAISAATGKMSTALRQLSVVVETKMFGDKSEVEFVLNFGKKGLKKTDHISAELDGEELFVYEISENSKKMYKAAFSVPQYDSQKGKDVMTEVINIKVNREKDKFEFMIINDHESYMTGEEVEERYVVSGKFVEEGDAVTISVQEYEKIYGEDVESVKLDINVTIDKKDKMPKLEKKGDVKSVFEMSMDDFEEIVENFQKEFEDFIASETPDYPAETPWGDYADNNNNNTVGKPLPTVCVLLTIKDGNKTVDEGRPVLYAGYNPTLGEIISQYCAEEGYEDEPFDENALLVQIGDLKRESGERWVAYRREEGLAKEFVSIKDQPVIDGQHIIIALLNA